MKCRICGNEENSHAYVVREMMFGSRDEFEYFQCGRCDCLQISEYPTDMAKYYPANYYSYQPARSGNAIKQYLMNCRNSYIVKKDNLFGRLLSRVFPGGNLQSLSTLNLGVQDRILDIGCGSGALLSSLAEIGFEHLMGADPLNEHEIVYPSKFKILNKSIHEIEGQWDCIMFHHSFEHMPDPSRVFGEIKRLLKPNGICVIRIPTTSSYAWKHYGVDWVQLDAPRHFFLHSRESLSLLAKDANLDLVEVIYDSTPFQFWGSEQYKLDIPLRSSTSYAENAPMSIFSEKDISLFEMKSAQLNAEAQGDQAIFILKSGSGPE